MTSKADLPISIPARSGRGRSGHKPGVATFFVLAYALSWACLIPLVVTGSVVTAGTGWPTHFPALLGPLVAAVVVTARTVSPSSSCWTPPAP